MPERAGQPVDAVNHAHPTHLWCAGEIWVILTCPDFYAQLYDEQIASLIGDRFCEPQYVSDVSCSELTHAINIRESNDEIYD